jgi:pSer/pThr/pTyr-binding forkhead associated (FHA) protein
MLRQASLDVASVNDDHSLEGWMSDASKSDEGERRDRWVFLRPLPFFQPEDWLLVDEVWLPKDAGRFTFLRTRPADGAMGGALDGLASLFGLGLPGLISLDGPGVVRPPAADPGGGGHVQSIYLEAPPGPRLRWLIDAAKAQGGAIPPALAALVALRIAELLGAAEEAAVTPRLQLGEILVGWDGRVLALPRVPDLDEGFDYVLDHVGQGERRAPVVSQIDAIRFVGRVLSEVALGHSRPLPGGDLPGLIAPMLEGCLDARPAFASIEQLRQALAKVVATSGVGSSALGQLASALLPQLRAQEEELNSEIDRPMEDPPEEVVHGLVRRAQRSFPHTGLDLAQLEARGVAPDPVLGDDAHLLDLLSPEGTHRFAVTGQNVVIGRDGRADIALGHPEVAFRQLLVGEEGGSLYIEPLDGMTMLNGEPLLQRRPFHIGDAAEFSVFTLQTPGTLLEMDQDALDDDTLPLPLGDGPPSTMEDEPILEQLLDSASGDDFDEDTSEGPATDLGTLSVELPGIHGTWRAVLTDTHDFVRIDNSSTDSIGRSPPPGLVQHHAIVRRIDDTIFVEPGLGPVFVNDERCSHARPVSTDDRIRLGDLPLTLAWGARPRVQLSDAEVREREAAYEAARTNPDANELCVYASLAEPNTPGAWHPSDFVLGVGDELVFGSGVDDETLRSARLCPRHARIFRRGDRLLVEALDGPVTRRDVSLESATELRGDDQLYFGEVWVWIGPPGVEFHGE